MDIVFSYRIHGLLIKIAHKTDVKKAGKHTVAANIIVPKKAYGPLAPTPIITKKNEVARIAKAKTTIAF
jgi:hypothetical protein